jgi:hypothetical protein
VQYAPWPNLSAHKTSHSRDLQRLISVRQPVNELMRCLSTTVGDVGRWDGFVQKGQRKIAVMLHLRSSREKVAEGLESQAIASVIVECRSTAETSR